MVETMNTGVEAFNDVLGDPTDVASNSKQETVYNLSGGDKDKLEDNEAMTANITKTKEFVNDYAKQVVPNVVKGIYSQNNIVLGDNDDLFKFVSINQKSGTLKSNASIESIINYIFKGESDMEEKGLQLVFKNTINSDGLGDVDVNGNDVNLNSLSINHNGKLLFNVNNKKGKLQYSVVINPQKTNYMVQIFKGAYTNDAYKDYAIYGISLK